MEIIEKTDEKFDIFIGGIIIYMFIVFFLGCVVGFILGKFVL